MSTTDLDFYALDPATQAYILHHQPALDPPAGQQPNFDNPPNGSAGVAVLFAICLALATVGFAARVYTRFLYTKEKAPVDLRDLETPGLFGPQYDDIFIVEQLNTVVLCLLKVAILLDWIRLFAPSRTGFVYWASHVTIWATIGFYVARLVVFNVACTPYALNWNEMLKDNCDRVNMYGMSIATCIFHIVSEMQRAIWKLHMTTQKKLSVSVVFAIGLLAFISTVIRSVETVLIFSSTDVMHGYSVGACLGAAELTCGFLTITVPSIPQTLSSPRKSKLVSTRWCFGFSRRRAKASSDASAFGLASPHAGRYYEMGNMESGAASAHTAKRHLVAGEISLHGGSDAESDRV
ncbi:hypothetical protein PG984_002877 [Apiospora sp. TS-2023a]